MSTKKKGKLSKRLRFEIFKRDGFKCLYCGAAPTTSPLHVDHVEPTSKGGTNDPANLVTSCMDCNLGKSAVPLSERKLQASKTSEAQLEQAEQIRAYLAIQREVAAARSEVASHVEAYWRERCGDLPDELPARILGLVDRYGLPTILEGIDIVGRKRDIRYPTPRLRYFYGILRNWRESRGIA